MAERPVVFDGTALRPPLLGVGRSFLETLAAWLPAASAPCVLLLPAGVPAPALAGVEVVAMRGGFLARQLALPRMLRRLRARLLHVPFAAVPAAAPCPVLATVHDLPWRAPVRLREEGAGWRHRFAAGFAAANARLVLVPSRATAADLLRDAGPAAAARVRVVPHGLPLPAAPAAPAELTGPFLVLGDARPRKNLERLAAAHKIARSAVRDLPELLLLGPGQPAGFVDDGAKTAHLRRARALVHVALHEGFGLPVLEALGHGVPVVCGRTPAVLEVAAGAALATDATDPHAIAAALIAVHTDAGRRTRLQARGRARAAELTPQRAAALWSVAHREALA